VQQPGRIASFFLPLSLVPTNSLLFAGEILPLDLYTAGFSEGWDERKGWRWDRITPGQSTRQGALLSFRLVDFRETCYPLTSEISYAVVIIRATCSAHEWLGCSYRRRMLVNRGPMFKSWRLGSENICNRNHGVSETFNSSQSWPQTGHLGIPCSSKAMGPIV
jgi:hypothetical protein